ncbi:MAG: GvpL/GvpF family gas vesicle protein, partial [Chloroflexota bacterium]|nr:GvpL/GvpF family gas vesicle protein [Chloroflexota bacterium]
MGDAVYAYAIVPWEAPIPAELRGMEGRPVSLVRYEELAAVTSALEDAAVQSSPEHVLQHEAVVEAIRELGPGLPVRFGTVLPGEDAVRAALSARYTVLRSDLERLGDKVELGVTALWCVAPAPTDDAEPDRRPDRGPGTQYMRERLRQHRRESQLHDRADTVWRTLDSALGKHSLESRRKASTSPRMAVRATYLVAPPGIDGFKAAFEALRASIPDLHLLLTG